MSKLTQEQIAKVASEVTGHKHSVNNPITMWHQVLLEHLKDHKPSLWLSG